MNNMDGKMINYFTDHLLEEDNIQFTVGEGQKRKLACSSRGDLLIILCFYTAHETEGVSQSLLNY